MAGTHRWAGQLSEYIFIDSLIRIAPFGLSFDIRVINDSTICVPSFYYVVGAYYPPFKYLDTLHYIGNKTNSIMFYGTDRDLIQFSPDSVVITYNYVTDSLYYHYINNLSHIDSFNTAEIFLSSK